MGSTDVAVVIPTYNGRRLVERCLHSLQSTTYPFSVTVVDDHSTDGTCDFLRERFPWVRVIHNKRNVGPAASKNVGIKATDADLVATLDNDTVTTPTWLERHVELMVKDPRTGACGSKLLNLRNDRLLNSTGGLMTRTGHCWDRGLFEVDNHQYEEIEEVISVCTAAAIFRRDALNRVGWFDEKFFYPLEDADMGLRLNIAGYKVLYNPSSVVYHEVGATMGRINPRKTYLSERNRLRMLIKNFDLLTLVRLGPDVVRGMIEQIAFWAFMKGDVPLGERLLVLQAYARAILWNFLNLYDTLRRREKILRMKCVSDALILSRTASRMPSILFPDYLIQNRQSFKESNRKVDVICFGKNDSLALGYGWYALDKPQTDPSMVFRWTRDEATAYMSLSEPSVLNLEIFGIPQIIGRPVKGRISVNESDVGGFEIRRDGWHIISFEVEPFAETTCEIKIEVNTPWFPSKVLRNRDPRLLGVGVRKIWLEKEPKPRR